jgi:DNA gyrase/topoisomerase IV subunit A
MNKEQMQQDIDAMREKLAEMEAKLKEKEKVKKYFIPELEEDYWSCDSWCGPCLEKNDNTNYDIHKIATGNCYKTEEEALKADAQQKAYVRIIRALRDHEEEGCARDYIIFYSSEFSHYSYHTTSYNLMVFGNQIKELFSTRDACQWVIENMKYDLNLYFGE